jgi:LCP family protein required for cell wall assembly
MRNPFKKKDPLAAERYSGMIRGVRVRDKGRFRWLRRKWVWFVAGFLVLVGIAGGYAWWYYSSLKRDTQVDIPPVTEPEDDERPFNALLVGSDSRAGLTEQEQQDLGADDIDPETGEPIVGGRADTLIFAHVDPGADRVTMVQFPRDFYVPYANGGKGKINSALLEGRATLVQTVEDFTGLDINRYAEVNIAGFRDLVDALGGVEVCIPEPIPFDEATGIEVPPEEIGMVEFDGERAIRFVRSRKVFGEGDFARIQNQQKFLSAAIDKATSPRTFLNLGTLHRLRDIAGKNLKVDHNTDPFELYDLLKRFRAFNPDNYEAYTAPDLGITENEAGSVVLPDVATIRAMFDAIERNESPETASTAPEGVDPDDVVVAVYNGANHDRVVAKPAARELIAATTLDGEQIDVAEIANADRDGFRKTVIRYERDARRQAEFMAAAIPGARLQRADTGLGLDVEVIVGRQFRTRRLIRVTPIEIPKPGELPEVCED